MPWTHNLDDVLTFLMPHYPALGSLRRGAIFLSPFAVATRYPGRNARKRQAEAAWRWAGRMRREARALLGLPPSPP